MKISMRRAFSTILAAALLLGSVPSEVQAQVARVAVGEAGRAPVSPVGSSAAGMTMAPALNIGGANLAGSLSAPSFTPSPVSVAPAFRPAAANDAAPAALSGAVRAAAADAPRRPFVRKAAAPVEKKTWRQRIASAFGRAATPSITAAAADAKADGDRAFDGAAEISGAADAPAIAGGAAAAPRGSGLQAARPAAIALKTVPTVDAFGGPATSPMSLKERVGYGLKKGLHLIGASAILEITLRPILNAFPWPQYMSDQALRAFERVALLTKYGPNELVANLADSPALFFAVDLPLAVTMEEISYRLVSFGLTFLSLAAVRPVSRWISSMIDGLPNAAGVVGGAQRVLKIGEWVSRFAFPIAAGLSSVSFAAAHFAVWGFSPFVLVLNIVLGLILARTAYKSRGLTASIIAHLLFNVVSIGGLLIAMSLSPLAGGAFAIIAGLVGIASLLHSWLSARKERSFRVKNGGKALAALMIVGTSLSLLGGATHSPVTEAPSRAAASAAIQRINDNKTEGGVQQGPAQVGAVPAAPVAAKVESRDEMVARVKGSVVNVLVRVPEGMATGSGFILTPRGIFITNAHVVGSRQPGEFVEARVPGVTGIVKAKVLAVNHDKDLAIVQLAPRPDGKPWPIVSLAANAPREGEPVTAAGYPRGLPFTVTAGVLSGMNGRGNMYVKHLQTDASINPGNSGGPLFNAQGEVIGVNTQIYTQSGGSEGLGFSIMAPEVGRVMAQFAKTGNIATASLGVIANLSDPVAPEAGLEIEYVRHGSAAEKAGLKRGDLILALGDDAIEEGGQEAAKFLANALSKMIPGQKTTVTVLRGDDVVELELTVDAKVTEAPGH